MSKQNKGINLRCLTTLECKQGAIRAVRFNVDGSYCLTCGADRRIKLWNPYRQLLLKTYAGHGDDVLDACASCDSSQIVSCGADRTVILWDVSTGQTLRRFRAHDARVCCVCFNEESSVAVSGSQDNTVKCWDVRSRNMQPIQVLRDAKDSITSVCVTDHEILSSSADCKIRRYDIRNNKLYSDFMGEAVTCTSLTHDGQCSLVSCSDNTVRLLDKNSGELLGEYVGHQMGDYCIQSCMDVRDTYVMSGSACGNIWVWDLVDASVVQKLSHASNQVVTSLSSHPTQQCILSGAGATVKLWSTAVQDDNDNSQI